MQRILVSLIAAVSLVGCDDAPDKTYTGVAGATHDCGKERKVAVSGSGGTFIFTGICEHASLNGGANKVTIEATKTIAINGVKNVVEIGAVDRIAVTGSDNVVTYRTGIAGSSPHTAAASGNNNSITQAK